jgi:hypothetical protein
MTKELAEFVNGLRCGFINVKQGLELRSIDRLCPVLVRCQCVRFVCGVQDLETMIARMRAAGDEVRDVSVTSEVLEQARKFLAVPAVKPWAISKAMHAPRAHAFNESDCGGAFDGNQVISDADPGL